MESSEENTEMFYHLLYSTTTLMFGGAVLFKYFRNELRLGVRSILALVVVFVAEPICHFAVGGDTGLVVLTVWYIITYIALPANHLDIGDRAILITGCDSGLGQALAQYFDQRGFQVFAGCLYKGGAAEVELSATCSEKLTTLQLDVTKDEEIQQALKTVTDKLQGKGLWGLINNAGVFSFMDVELTPVHIYEEMMEVNCLGVVRMTKTFLPLIRQCTGRVVNVSSTYGRVPLMGMSAYGISKAGVEMFSDVLRQEMKKWGIKVSLVEPYGYLTATTSVDKMEVAYRAMIANLSDDMRQLYGTQYFETYHSEVVQQEGKALRSMESLSDNYRFLCRCVRDALLSKRPQARYPDGSGARIMMWFADHLPDTVLDLCLPYILPDWVHSQTSTS
ncbi:17-beta-hydroxysteroid dehydrogenase type 6-like [Glandiceps talaboti]